MRNKIFILTFIAILAMLLSACASTALAQSGSETDQAETRTISVNGSGTVSIIPDLATISIGVHTEGKDAAEAVSGNNTQTEKVMTALTDFGIASKDIQTSNFSIYPRQDLGPNGEQQGITYAVDNTVTVTVRELDTIGEVLNAVVQAGANNINGIQFDVNDRESAYQQALDAAVENAASRASVLAKAAGVELGDVQKIETNISGGGTPAPMERAYALSAASDVPVSAGEMLISVEVQMVYGIR